MMMFPLNFEQDDNGTLLVTCPLLPEVTTFGENLADAISHGAEAVEEAIAARVAKWEDVPIPARDDSVAAFEESRATRISLLAEMKLDLYLACREASVTRADLVRRLGWRREQVDRLFRFDHASRVDQIDAAISALGRNLDVKVTPAHA
jgi:antitoxin HicB